VDAAGLVPEVAGDVVAEEGGGAEGRYLSDELLGWDAAGAIGDAVPVVAGVVAGLGVAAVVAGERAGGWTAGAGRSGHGDGSGLRVGRPDGEGGVHAGYSL